jgi:hypothetical protein
LTAAMKNQPVLVVIVLCIASKTAFSCVRLKRLKATQKAMSPAEVQNTVG